MYHAPRRWTSRQAAQRFPLKSPVVDPLDSVEPDRMTWAANLQRPDSFVCAGVRLAEEARVEDAAIPGGDPCLDAVQQLKVTFCTTEPPHSRGKSGASRGEEWQLSQRVPGSGSGSQRLQPPSHDPRTGLNCHMGKNQTAQHHQPFVAQRSSSTLALCPHPHHPFPVSPPPVLDPALSAIHHTCGVRFPRPGDAPPAWTAARWLPVMATATVPVAGPDPSPARRPNPALCHHRCHPGFFSGADGQYGEAGVYCWHGCSLQCCWPRGLPLPPCDPIA